MRTSPRGVALIKSFEGLKLDAYKCPAGVWTIGYGHTGSAAKEGAHVSEFGAELLLRENLQHFESSVWGLTHGCGATPTPNQFDALVSFAFNVGAAAFENSTLRKKFLAGDVQGAADQFPRWNKAGGKILLGLKRRRDAEKALFLSE